MNYKNEIDLSNIKEEEEDSDKEIDF